MRKKRALTVFVAAVVSLVMVVSCLSGCAGSSSQMDLFEMLESESESLAAADGYSPVIINLVHSSSETSAVSRVAHMFKTLLEEESKGEILVEIYPNDSLGYVYDYGRALREGTVDCWIGSGGLRLNSVVYWASTLTGVSLERIREFLESDNYLDAAKKGFDKSGYKMLALFPAQYRALTSNHRIDSLDDLPELHMRSFMGGSREVVYWDALGVSTKSYDIHELYSALESGEVDSQSNTLPLIVSNRLYEQQEYLIDLRHMIYFDGLFMGTAFYENLTESQREVVDNVAEEVRIYAQDMYQAEADRCELVLQKSGMKFLPLSDELREEIRQIAAPALEASLRESAGDELVDFVINGLK